MFKVLITDVDGVLTSIGSIWDYLHRCFGTKERADIHRELYRRGLIDYVAWAKLDAMLWRGISWSDVVKCVLGIPVRKGVRELFEFVRSRGLKVIAVSAGLDVVYYVLESVGAAPDVLVSNRLRVVDGKLTGDVLVLVTDRNKGDVMEYVLKIFDLSPREAVVIGDGEVDIPMMSRAGLAIAFNPESPDVEKVANYIIRGDDLYPVVDVLRSVLVSRERHLGEFTS